jgi:hypothetical protein
VNRLREFAGRPLDPSIARAILVLGCAVTVATGLLIAGGILSPGGSVDPRLPAGRDGAVRPTVPSPYVSPGRPARDRRNPLDERGNPTRRRAERELAGHRALQHLPWRGDGAKVTLVGAHGGLAVLEVAAVDRAVARRGYLAFLARSHDDGADYLVRVRATRGSR